MRNRNFGNLLKERWSAGSSVCIGLDSDISRVPRCIRRQYTEHPQHIGAAMMKFNREIVRATNDLVCAYKVNSAFYECHGAEGYDALKGTIGYIHRAAPKVPVILDAKRADISATNTRYADWAFDRLRADAVTVHPYTGRETMEPFLRRENKGVFVLCRTSNPGSDEFQNLPVHDEPLHRVIARHVAETWNKNKNCGIVAGATYPDDLREIRKAVGDMPILIPGIGTQGGDIQSAVREGGDENGGGIIINSSRSIIFASREDDFAEAARCKTEELRDAINRHRK